MEKNPDDSSNHSSVCEKIFKAISINTVRSATPAIERSQSTVGSTPAIGRSRSILGCQLFEVLNKKDQDLVPLNLERSITIQIGGEGSTIQSDIPQMSIHQSLKKREPALMDNDSVKENNPKLKAEKTQSTKTVAEKENDNVAVQHASVDKLATKVEPKPKQPSLSVHDRLKSKELISRPTKVVLEQIHTEGANNTQKSGHGTTHVSVQDQKNDDVAVQHASVDKLATKVESKPKQPSLSVHDRLKSKVLVRPTKVVLEQIHTEGANNTQKSGHGTTTHVSMQDQEKFKYNIDKDSPVNRFKDDQRKDRKGGESNKSILYTNSNDKFSDYINRTKLKIRATSDVGTGNDTPRVDSMNEKVNDFIHRAKFKIRTSSSKNGGSWSFK